ncbi:MAG TPA: glycosyltransferase [Casimicrobiaceae bacterium]|nr:glycosyltransferase [Casimicrobiaceae bacterium]
MSATATTFSASQLPIVCHSHLRWDFVWQRPQQVLARLADRHRVAFVEEPITDAAATRLEISEPTCNVVRVVPHVRGPGGDVDAQCSQLRPLLQRALREHPLCTGRFGRVIQWFYSPMVAPGFLGSFDTATVVYDCMDELSKFRFAPKDLEQREVTLLSAADIVFAGGHRLSTRKSRQHPNVHFYGCGVDVDHYARSRDAATALPADVAALPHPMLGYFGVVDERLDYSLIDELARAFAHGSIVIVGPLAKVDRENLPTHRNLHWLGQRTYQELPAYVKAFDACLMPFALNDATEYINPTKALEYMAAGKPVISTAVPDVIRNFAPVAQVARSHAEFIALAARACAAPDAALLAAGLELAREATWESVVAAMRARMLEAVRARSAATSPALPS